MMDNKERKELGIKPKVVQVKPLTDNELKAYQLRTQGMTYQEIGKALGVAWQVIQRRVQNSAKKLNIANTNMPYTSVNDNPAPNKVTLEYPDKIQTQTREQEEDPEPEVQLKNQIPFVETKEFVVLELGAIKISMGSSVVRVDYLTNLALGCYKELLGKHQLNKSPSYT